VCLLHRSQLLLQTIHLALLAGPQSCRLLLQALVRGTCSFRQLLLVLLVGLQGLRLHRGQLRLLLLLELLELLLVASCCL
jgi:hypothetical protein